MPRISDHDFVFGVITHRSFGCPFNCSSKLCTVPCIAMQARHDLGDIAQVHIHPSHTSELALYVSRFASLYACMAVVLDIVKARARDTPNALSTSRAIARGLRPSDTPLMSALAAPFAASSPKPLNRSASG